MKTRMRQYYYQDQKVKLHGFFQESEIVAPSMLIGGHGGGVLTYPVAVVEFEDGRIGAVKDFFHLRSKPRDRKLYCEEQGQ